MISFNFESSMTMSISKQYNIKFVITIKIPILDIKLVLFHIINKKRFNFIDEPILKPQYSDIFFDSKSIFNSNSDASRKINIDILNL